nr:MAG TPA: hypothetical protein [Caudoviricetes sp.]
MPARRCHMPSPAIPLTTDRLANSTERNWPAAPSALQARATLWYLSACHA